MKHVKSERNPFSARQRLVSPVILIRMCAMKQAVSVDFCVLPQMFPDWPRVVRSRLSR